MKHIRRPNHFRLDRQIRWLFVLALMTAAPVDAGVAAPEFAQYPAKAHAIGAIAPPDLKSHPRARMFRTRLRHAAAKGPTFAGYLAVAQIGCGTGCQIYFFISATDGKVSGGPTSTAGAEWRKDSRLFIVNPPKSTREAYGGKVPDYAKARYYEWREGKLVEIGAKAR